MSSKIVFGVALALSSLLLASIVSAEQSAPLHRGPWPIRNGRNYQPTEQELKALHREDVTPGQALEIDRLYHQLLKGSETRNLKPGSDSIGTESFSLRR